MLITTSSLSCALSQVAGTRGKTHFSDGVSRNSTTTSNSLTGDGELVG